MTETVPETDDLPRTARKWADDYETAWKGCDCEGDHCPHERAMRDWRRVESEPEMVRRLATALEAAQARIAELEARPTIKTHDGAIAALVSDVEIAATARREALEDAANTERECPTHVTDAYRLGWSDAMKVRTERIRALMEKPNG